MRKKKIKVPSNVRKIQLYVMLVLPNMTIALSNVRKKIKESLNVTKLQLYVIVGIAQCDDGTIKCDEKKGNYQM